MRLIIIDLIILPGNCSFCLAKNKTTLFMLVLQNNSSVGYLRRKENGSSCFALPRSATFPHFIPCTCKAGAQHNGSISPQYICKSSSLLLLGKLLLAALCAPGSSRGGCRWLLGRSQQKPRVADQPRDLCLSDWFFVLPISPSILERGGLLHLEMAACWVCSKVDFWAGTCRPLWSWFFSRDFAIWIFYSEARN